MRAVGISEAGEGEGAAFPCFSVRQRSEGEEKKNEVHDILNDITSCTIYLEQHHDVLNGTTMLYLERYHDVLSDITIH